MPFQKVGCVCTFENLSHILSSFFNSTTGIDKGKTFKGCLGEIRVGGYLLPFFPHTDIYKNGLINNHFQLNSSKPDEGCVLCFEQDCKNQGTCGNPREEYACKCPPGFGLDDCSENIDECLTANCTNNSSCIDGIANFTCVCQPGFEGQLCEHEINECLTNPCHNGGTCTDLVAEFSCQCTEDYDGPQCDVLRQVTCANVPCRNGSTCINGHSK
jgi:protein crumbs